MALIFFFLVGVGFFAVVCNVLSALGSVICALLKYVVMPLIIIFFLGALITGSL